MSPVRFWPRPPFLKIIISNPNDPKPCGCLNENDGKDLTWYADGHQSGKWINWCSGSGAESDPNCPSATSGTNGESLNAFNTKNHCGYSDWLNTNGFNDIADVDLYWSSVFDEGPSNAWSVIMGSGYCGYMNIDDMLHLLVVRGS